MGKGQQYRTSLEYEASILLAKRNVIKEVSVNIKRNEKAHKGHEKVQILRKIQRSAKNDNIVKATEKIYERNSKGYKISTKMYKYTSKTG